MPNYSGATQKAQVIAQTATAKSNRAWVRENLEAIESGLTQHSYESYVQMLNNEFDFNISVSLFGKYLSEARKKRRTRPTATNASSSLPGSSTSPDHDIQDEWNDTEKLIGYRLEECIRPYVQVVDGNIVRNFKKGTIYNAEIRKAIQRLRNVVDPD